MDPCEFAIWPELNSGISKGTRTKGKLQVIWGHSFPCWSTWSIWIQSFWRQRAANIVEKSTTTNIKTAHSKHCQLPSSALADSKGFHGIVIFVSDLQKKSSEVGNFVFLGSRNRILVCHRQWEAWILIWRRTSRNERKKIVWNGRLNSALQNWRFNSTLQNWNSEGGLQWRWRLEIKDCGLNSSLQN